MALEDCKTYLGQTTSYVGANGKRLGVLCVLDCSPKMRPAFPRRMKSGGGILPHQESETSVYVITILIQGCPASPRASSHCDAKSTSGL
jgi:hypothetical protein